MSEQSFSLSTDAAQGGSHHRSPRQIFLGGTFGLDFEYVPDVAQGRLADRVELEVANLKQATQVIVQYHYLHRGRTMAQLPYWVTLDGRRVGVLLFALPRMSASFHGHRAMSLLELARMYLVPTVQELIIRDSNGRQHAFSVASCAVGKALRRCRQDWYVKYPHLPDIEAVVSWADMVHHEGVIYRAANFQEVGVSGGSLHGHTRRPNGGRDQLNPDYMHLKRAFLYEYRKPLTPAQKARLASHLSCHQTRRVDVQRPAVVTVPAGQVRLLVDP